jgi:alpha-tubulin suppressor-like RCC1 family protein
MNQKKTKQNKISRRSFLARASSFASAFGLAQLPAVKAWSQFISHAQWRNRTGPGTIWLWGANTLGQIGDNTQVDRSSPVLIGALARYIDVSTGSSDTDNTLTFAVRDNNTLWAWGYNNAWQLGTGNNTSYSSPVQIGGTADWAKAYAGFFRGFAIKTNGTLWAWGSNSIFGFDHGALGNNSSLTASLPIQIGSDTNWSNISTCKSHTLALKTDGTLWAWGGNGAGQLGDGSATTRSSPIQVGSDTNWVKIATGGELQGVGASLALKSDGTMWFWGRENNLNPRTYLSPNQVGSLTNWSKVVASASRAMAIKTDGTLWVWGSGTSGSMGLGSQAVAYSPTQLGTDTNWADAAVSDTVSLAIKSTGTLWAWGANGNGELGDGTTTTRSSPVQIGGLTDWSRVAVRSSSYAIKTNGTLWSWSGGLLGDGLGRRSSPAQVGAETNWAEIKTGTSHVMVLKSNGTLWAWGNNDFGQLGLNLATYSPVQKTSDTDWSIVSSARSYVLAIKTNGTLWGWGGANWGQLGLGSTLYAVSPVQIGSDTNWDKVYASDVYSMAIKTNGTLWAIGGLGTSGQFGNGTGNRSSPVQIGSDSNWQNLSLGYTYSHAVKTDGTLWAWGSSTAGALGLGATTVVTSPVQVGADNDWARTFKSSNSGANFVLARKANNSLWAWGSNSNGALGDGTTVSKSSPIQIGSDTDWSLISCGPQTVLALKSAGTMWAWGSNSTLRYGMVSASRSSPVQVGSDTDWLTVETNGAETGNQTNQTYAIKTNGTLWAWGSTGLNLGLGASSMTTAVTLPTQIGSDTNWSKISAGGAVYAIKTTGTLWGWGSNSQGQLMIDALRPSQVGSDTDWSKIATGENHTLALRTTGTLWAWGRNHVGQIGNGASTSNSYFSPVQVGAETDWTEISTFTNLSFGLRGTGTLWAWGVNWSGELGDGTFTSRSSPVQIGADNWQGIFSGGSSYGIKSGQLWSWGSNSVGQLGLFNGSPVQLGTATNWAEVSVGDSAEFALAVTSTGTLWAWGVNWLGMLGTNNTTTYSSPVQVGALSDWSKVATGGRFSLAIKTNGTLWAWGNGGLGRLGLGNTTSYSSPVQVGTTGGWQQISAGQSTSAARK